LPVTAVEYELLCRLANGDRDAFDTIYHQYFHSVYCNALKITRDRVAAEDVLQEVFTTLWEKREMISLEQPPGGWLFVLCYNKSINLLRKKMREARAYQQLQEQATNELPDEMKYGKQWQILEDAMAQLSPQKRKVFELCKMQHKTYEEAASALRISKYTVKEYLSVAVSFLKEYVHQHPESSIVVNAGIFLFMLVNSSFGLFL
jgi:RNA polymerase sigma-70 factor (ECF subfamily)